MSKVEHDLGGSLRCSIEERDGTVLVSFTGNVGENADFTALTRLRAPLTVDLAQIGRINSPGVRQWVHFVRDCESAGMVLTFVRCPPVVVGQMGMISNFMGRSSRVRSVLTPYVCTACHEEEFTVLECTPGMPLDIPHTKPCTACGAAMEFDELEETYTALFARR